MYQATVQYVKEKFNLMVYHFNLGIIKIRMHIKFILRRYVSRLFVHAIGGLPISCSEGELNSKNIIFRFLYVCIYPLGQRYIFKHKIQIFFCIILCTDQHKPDRRWFYFKFHRSIKLSGDLNIKTNRIVLKIFLASCRYN